MGQMSDRSMKLSSSIPKPSFISRASYSSVLRSPSPLKVKQAVDTDTSVVIEPGWRSPGQMALDSLSKLGKVRDLMRERQLDA